MSNIDFSTPEHAETLFYKAFEDCDLESMMQVWEQSEDIICIHPMSPRLTGMKAIVKSWTDIFQYSPKVKIEINTQSYLRTGDMSVHILHEIFHVEGENTPQSPVIATNVYKLTESGWRMILHHASSLPKPRTQSKEKAAPVLH